MGGPLLVIGIQTCRACSESITGDAALINEPLEVVHVLAPLVFRRLNFGRLRKALGMPEAGTFHSRDAGDSRPREYLRWIEDLPSKCPRRYTSLWIGTTTK